MSVTVDRPRAGEVHVWIADLDRRDWPLRELVALLDPNERERAVELATENRRRRFVVAHGILRALAGRYASVDPSSVAFIHSPAGRPALVAARGGPVPATSWSRSGRVGLYAFASGLDIGVDVEVVRPVAGLLEIARRLLPPDVHTTLTGLRPSDRPAAFAAWWTRAEACVKARGDGLAAAARLVARTKPSALQLAPAAGGAPVVSHDLAIGCAAAAAVAVAATAVQSIEVHPFRPDALGCSPTGGVLGWPSRSGRLDPLSRRDSIDTAVEGRDRTYPARLCARDEVSLGEVDPVEFVDLEGAQEQGHVGDDDRREPDHRADELRHPRSFDP